MSTKKRPGCGLGPGMKALNTLRKHSLCLVFSCFFLALLIVGGVLDAEIRGGFPERLHFGVTMGRYNDRPHSIAVHFAPAKGLTFILALLVFPIVGVMLCRTQFRRVLHAIFFLASMGTLFLVLIRRERQLMVGEGSSTRGPCERKGTMQLKEFRANYRCEAEKTIERSSQLLAQANMTFSSEDITSFLRGWAQTYLHHFTHYLFRIQIVNGNLFYVRSRGGFPSKQFSAEERVEPRLKLLLSDLEELMRKVALPNVDFLVWLGDGPIPDSMPANFPQDLQGSRYGPIFFQEFERGKNTLLLPPRSMQSCPDFGNVAALDNAISWHDKIPKAVFRGSPTGIVLEGKTWRDLPRSKAVMLSQKFPDLLDAGFSSLVQVTEEEKRDIRSLGLVKGNVKMEDQMRYKMILNVDGNSLADRFPHQLVGNSVILKQDSSRMEYWYEELTPGVHYLPIAQDMSDLIPTIQAFLSDEKQQQLNNIADSATEFVLRRLNSDNCWCYWASILESYSKYVREVTLAHGHEKWC